MGGYFAQYAPNHSYDLTTLFTDLGTDLRLGLTGIKPYACCRGCHSAIDVMHQMRSENQMSVDNVDAILVTCSASQFRQLGKVDPATVAEAQLSLPFAIALAPQFDTIGIDRFTAETITAPNSLKLANMVRFDVKDDWTPGVEPDLLVTLRNGDQLKGHVPAAKGDPKNPMTTEQVVLKFRQLVSDRLGASEQDHLIAFRNTLMGLIKHRGLAAILPKMVVQETHESGPHVIPLVDPEVHRTYYLVERKDRLKKDETVLLEAFLRFELMAVEKIAREGDTLFNTGRKLASSGRLGTLILFELFLERSGES